MFIAHQVRNNKPMTFYIKLPSKAAQSACASISKWQLC
jgi:hypothetical protein